MGSMRVSLRAHSDRQGDACGAGPLLLLLLLAAQKHTPAVRRWCCQRCWRLLVT